MGSYCLSKIIDISSHHRFSAIEDDATFIGCPHCGNMEWAVRVEARGKKDAIPHLICCSEECEGRLAQVVTNGCLT
jgi:predicted aconitase